MKKRFFIWLLSLVIIICNKQVLANSNKYYNNFNDEDLLTEREEDFLNEEKVEEFDILKDSKEESQDLGKMQGIETNDFNQDDLLLNMPQNGETKVNVPIPIYSGSYVISKNSTIVYECEDGSIMSFKSTQSDKKVGEYFFWLHQIKVESGKQLS